MKVIKKIQAMIDLSRWAKASGKTIGFVPTMGALHEGHLSLIRKARTSCDIVVVSIFVNPIQFGPAEDFRKYPRDIEHDKRLISRLKVDVLFIPAKEDIYGKDFSTHVEVQRLGDKLCGASRPGHFKGVATVVMKLFNIVRPDIAFFGNKDYQQLVIIKKMVGDLNMGVKVAGLPTTREPDGLAMSSRNKYLSQSERSASAVIYRSLKLAKQMVESGHRSAKSVTSAMRSLISPVRPKVLVDYIAICDPVTLVPKGSFAGKTLISIACFVGRTRLIDNVLVKD